ncbi:glycerophosphodiester phosphodiesterase family protein [Hymenobacter endophyticus]|uniref:Glycerophosphodiester phosphodiesterase family protein n=1 Tax=Hymenobacter endophyticus TaxID=3076335 RepID=A0ABU3TLE6_9BACT|nr:glycerophosphodiester phosphodiesterase family protein [Hymenobacter endophyticus]MDU0372184.1 glycerophosphodiester phosphodiesterase family protein [Hymenobacter endophyticus]
MAVPEPASPFPQIHGHRGCRGLLPENTLPAFCRAVELGVDVLELDIVVSADHQLVVSHEPWMSATICRTPEGRPIEPHEQLAHNLYALPYARIREYDCGSIRHPLFPEQRPVAACKPLLREVIETVDALTARLRLPPVQFSIEVKSSPAGDGIWHPAPAGFLALLFAQLHSLRLFPRTTLLCFDKRILQLAREQEPALRLCLLVEDDRPIQDHLQELGFHPEVLGPDFRLLTSEVVTGLRQLNIALVPWTVNTPADLENIRSFRPLGITTDYPDRLLAMRAKERT